MMLIMMVLSMMMIDTTIRFSIATHMTLTILTILTIIRISKYCSYCRGSQSQPTNLDNTTLSLENMATRPRLRSTPLLRHPR